MKITYFNHMAECYSEGRFGRSVDVPKGTAMAEKAMALFVEPPFHYTHVDEQQPENVSIVDYVRNYPGDIFAKLFLSAIFERKIMDLV